jgi:riboflavin synthase
LTVVAQTGDEGGDLLEFELSHETLARTAFGDLRTGRRVNLERAMRLGDRLGGHLVSGHVDGVAVLEAVAAHDGAWDLTYAVPQGFEAELVVKGSVAIDGVSLTVNGLPPGRVQVTLIPHTVAHTQLLDGDPGKRVHLETDLLAKHVRRLLACGVVPGPIAAA